MSCTCKQCDQCISGLQAVVTACTTQMCEQQLSTDCIIYSGPDNECYGIYNGDTLTTVLEILFDQAFPECRTLTTTTTTSTTTSTTSTTTTAVPCVCYNVGYVGSSYGLSDTFTYLDCYRQSRTVTMSNGTNVVVCAIQDSMTFDFYFNNAVAIQVDPYYCGGCTTTTTTTTLNPSQTTTTTSTTTLSPSTTTTTAAPGTTTTTTATPGSTTTTTTQAPITGLTEAIIILQTGQSNAVGRAGADPANEVVVPLGAYEYKSNTNAVYALVDPTGISGDNSRATDRSMNPALAKRLVELLGKPVIIVCAAVGNTNIDSWIDTNASLYTTALSRWNAVKAYCTANGITILGSYIHWLQGENDAAIAMATDSYVSKFNTMVDLFKQNFAPNKIFATRVGYNDAGTITADSEKIMLAQKQLNFSKDEVIVGTYAPAVFVEGDTAKTGNKVHYTVKGLNIVGEDIATAIHRLRTLNKKPVLTENVTNLQDPVGYFDDIYLFRSLTPGVNNTGYDELFGRNNLTLSSGSPTYNGIYGLTVTGSSPLIPATVRTLTNTHDWSVELTLRLDATASSMIINGRSPGWTEDWLWIDSSSSIQLKANGVNKNVSLSGANFNQLTNLAITYTYLDNTVKVYVNSSLKASFTDWAFSSWQLAAFVRGYTATPTTILFTGALERIRVVKKALSIWEFDRSPNITTPPAIDWSFPFNGSIAEEQGDTTTVLKSVSAGNIAVTPTYDADGLLFNTDKYLLLGQQFVGLTTYTLETRVKFVSPSGIQYLTSQSTNTPASIGGGGNFIWFDVVSNIIRVQGDTGYGYWASLTGYDWTQFHIIKVVQTATTIELLIDGVSKGVQTAVTTPFKIGMVGAGHPTAAYNFNGTMDYFTVKNSI